MKLYVYRLKSQGGYKCRFSDSPFTKGIVKTGASYLSTFCEDNPEYDELTKFLINYFNIPFNEDIEIEL